MKLKAAKDINILAAYGGKDIGAQLKKRKGKQQSWEVLLPNSVSRQDTYKNRTSLSCLSDFCI